MQHIASFIESQQLQHNAPMPIKSDLPTQVSISPMISTSALPSIISNIGYDAVEHNFQALLPPGPATSSSAHMHLQTPQHRHQARAKFPMNAFMLWSHERRRQISEQNPSMHPTEVFKHLGSEWKKMGSAEKKPYTERAKRLWQQYKIDNPDYKLQFAKNKKATAPPQQQPSLSSMQPRIMVNHPISTMSGGIKAPTPVKRTMAMGAEGTMVGSGGCMLGPSGGGGGTQTGAGHSSQQNATRLGGDESTPLGDMVSTTHRNLRNQGLVREAAQFKKYVLDLVSNYDFIMLEHRNG